jgi:hypothetical protein
VFLFVSFESYVLQGQSKRRQDTQHKDIQPNGTQHNNKKRDIQPKVTEQSNTQHKT